MGEMKKRRLEGKIAVVTGANSGMGMATAAALSDMGANVIMLCRNEERGKAALSELQKKPGRKLDLILCDLGDLASVRRFAKQVRKKYERVDILVNNAGFISLDRRETADGFERQFGINHLGHFLLTELLKKQMVPGSRIVIVASGAHFVGRIHFDDINLTHGFNVVKAYSQSKLANVLYTRELSARLAPRGITVNCCHPGAVATNIGVDRETGFGRLIMDLLKPVFQTPENGARTAIFLASDPSVEGISGEYFVRCHIAPSSKRSKDLRLARRLTAFSRHLIKAVL